MAPTIGGALVAILIGLIVGLERERARRPEDRPFAGIRTFPILALAGYLAAPAPAALGAVLLGVAALAVASYLRDTKGGATTEAVALLTPLLGALVAVDRAPVAAAVGVMVTLLLAVKAPLHKLAGAISEEEIVAILKFGLVAAVLVPLLPTAPVGPYGAIVPRQVGIVVVIVSGVSLAGYILVRLLGGRTGWALAGLLGGLVSSTAVTLSLSARARSTPALVRPLAAGILLASMVLYARGAFLIGIFDLRLARHLLPRLAVLFVVAGGFALFELRGARRVERGDVALGNPVELGRAALMGLLFAAILLLARAAQNWLGAQGLWAAGAVGGLVDVDSVAVASARLRRDGLATLDAAAGSYLLATLANLVVKGGIVAIVGGAAASRRVLPGFAALALATLVLLLN